MVSRGPVGGCEPVSLVVLLTGQGVVSDLSPGLHRPLRVHEADGIGPERAAHSGAQPAEDLLAPGGRDGSVGHAQVRVVLFAHQAKPLLGQVAQGENPRGLAHFHVASAEVLARGVVPIAQDGNRGVERRQVLGQAGHGGLAQPVEATGNGDVGLERRKAELFCQLGDDLVTELTGRLFWHEPERVAARFSLFGGHERPPDVGGFNHKTGGLSI